MNPGAVPDADQRARRRLLTAYFAPASKHTGCSRDRPNPSVRLPGSARLLLSSRPLGPRHRNGDVRIIGVADVGDTRTIGFLGAARANFSRPIAEEQVRR